MRIEPEGTNFRGMGNDIISHVTRNRSANRKSALAGSTAALRMRPVRSVVGQVPFQRRLAPVARSADHHIFQVPFQVAAETAGRGRVLLRKINMLVGVRIVHLRKALDIPCVQMKSAAGYKWLSCCIIQDRQRIIGPVTIVIVYNDLSR